MFLPHGSVVSSGDGETVERAAIRYNDAWFRTVDNCPLARFIPSAPWALSRSLRKMILGLRRMLFPIPARSNEHRVTGI